MDKLAAMIFIIYIMTTVAVVYRSLKTGENNHPTHPNAFEALTYFRSKFYGTPEQGDREGKKRELRRLMLATVAAHDQTHRTEARVTPHINGVDDNLDYKDTQTRPLINMR